MKKASISIILLFLVCCVQAEDGYELWLRYKPLADKNLFATYQRQLQSISFYGNSATLNAAKKELQVGLRGLLGKYVPFTKKYNNSSVIVGTTSSIAPFITDSSLQRIGTEGFLISTSTIAGKKVIVITANTDTGVLYAVFHFLRMLQTGQQLDGINFESSPRIARRILNHWDNLDRHVERGYAGISLWNWHTLPG